MKAIYNREALMKKLLPAQKAYNPDILLPPGENLGKAHYQSDSTKARISLNLTRL